MHKLVTHFEQMLQNLRPPQERFDAARDLPNVVRDYLKAHTDFATVSPHTRLVGSYAQDLSVGDIKDVDTLVGVAGDPTANNPNARQIIRDLRSALDDLPDWDGLPDWLGRGGYAAIAVTRARRSVHVHFVGHDFHLDVVPCIAPDGFSEQLWVPDREWDRWITSHPVGVVNLITHLNSQHSKVRPLGKLLKHFRNHQMKIMKPKSYWLVALLIHQVQSGTLNLDQSLGEAFHDLLDGIYNKYASLLPRTDDATPNIKDPILGHNVSWNWGRPAFVTFMNRLDDGRRWSSNALEEADQAKAIQWWQRVFGEEHFPSNVEDYARALASAVRPGIAVTTPAGLILPSAPHNAPFTPVRPTTFHGDTND